MEAGGSLWSVLIEHAQGTAKVSAIGRPVVYEWVCRAEMEVLDWGLAFVYSECWRQKRAVDIRK